MSNEEQTQDETILETGTSEETTDAQPEETAPDARATFGLPDGWSDAEVDEWVNKAKDTENSKSEEGVYFYDPTRTSRELSQWSTAELVCALKGLLQNGVKGLTPAIIAEYSRREHLEKAWSEAEVLAFFREGTEPAKTTNGVWVKDVTRGKRKASDWTDEELVAWANGEIKPGGNASAEVLANELAVRFKLESDNNSPAAVIKRFKHKETTAKEVTEPEVKKEAATPEAAPAQNDGPLTALNVTVIDTGLANYAKNVAKGKVLTEASGAQQQQSLDGLFNFVLRLEPQAMVRGLERIKKFVGDNREGVFSPNMAYRFVHGIKGDTKQKQFHMAMIELFLIVTGKNKALRKQIDVAQMLRSAPPQHREKLVEYFTNVA